MELNDKIRLLLKGDEVEICTKNDRIISGKVERLFDRVVGVVHNDVLMFVWKNEIKELKWIDRS